MKRRASAGAARSLVCFEGGRKFRGWPLCQPLGAYHLIGRLERCAHLMMGSVMQRLVFYFAFILSLTEYYAHNVNLILV